MVIWLNQCKLRVQLGLWNFAMLYPFHQKLLWTVLKKMSYYQYRKSNYKDKTVMGLSYFYNAFLQWWDDMLYWGMSGAGEYILPIPTDSMHLVAVMVQWLPKQNSPSAGRPACWPQTPSHTREHSGELQPLMGLGIQHLIVTTSMLTCVYSRQVILRMLRITLKYAAYNVNQQ